MAQEEEVVEEHTVAEATVIEVHCRCERPDLTQALYEQDKKAVEKARPFTGLLRTGGMNKVVFCIRNGFFLKFVPPLARAPLNTAMNKFRPWILPDYWPFPEDENQQQINEYDPKEIWDTLKFPPQLSDPHKQEILQWLQVLTCPSCSVFAIDRFKKFLVDASPPYHRLIRLLLEEGDTKLEDIERQGIELPGYKKVYASLVKYRGQIENHLMARFPKDVDPGGIPIYPEDSEMLLSDLFDSGLLARAHLCALDKVKMKMSPLNPNDPGYIGKLQNELAQVRATLLQRQQTVEMLQAENARLVEELASLKDVGQTIVQAKKRARCE